MSDRALLILTISIYLVTVWLAFRDSGVGRKALQDAKSSNDKAWEMQAEYADFKSLMDENFKNVLAQQGRIEEAFEAMSARIEELHQHETKRLEEYGAFRKTLEKDWRDFADGYVAELKTERGGLRDEVVKDLIRKFSDTDPNYHEFWQTDIGNSIRNILSRLDDLESRKP